MPSHQQREDEERLARGEDPATSSPREARRWISVYTELVEMETTLIKSLKARIQSMSDEARQITEQTNLPELEKDADRFRSRLAFWRQRLAQIERPS
jgi:hypothetical protein